MFICEGHDGVVARLQAASDRVNDGRYFNRGWRSLSSFGKSRLRLDVLVFGDTGENVVG
jgi:hypothetical protein